MCQLGAIEVPESVAGHQKPISWLRRELSLLLRGAGRDRPEAACPPGSRAAVGGAGGFNAVQKLLTNRTPTTSTMTARTTSGRSGILAGPPLSMVMHVGNSGGSRAWQGQLGRRPDWGIGHPGQRVSAKDPRPVPPTAVPMIAAAGRTRSDRSTSFLCGEQQRPSALPSLVRSGAVASGAQPTAKRLKQCPQLRQRSASRQ